MRPNDRPPGEATDAEGTTPGSDRTCDPRPRKPLGQGAVGMNCSPCPVTGNSPVPFTGVGWFAVGNVGKQRDATTGGHAEAGHAARNCCGTHAKPRSHDTSRIAWAKLIARVGEEFPLLCPACGGDIRLISFITEPGPIGKILTHVLLHPEWRTARTAADLSRSRAAHRLGRAPPGSRRPRRPSSVTRRAARDRHSPPVTAAGREGMTKPRDPRTRRDSAPTREKRHSSGDRGPIQGAAFWAGAAPGRREQPAHESLISWAKFAEVPLLAGLSFPVGPTPWEEPLPPTSAPLPRRAATGASAAGSPGRPRRRVSSACWD